MVMIGIDPHKRTHTAVAIDTAERVLDERLVRATSKQVPELLEWVKRLDGGDRIWAIESAGGLGYLLAQQLLAAGEHVVDIPATLASRVRLLGTGRSDKNDPNGAARLRSPRAAPRNWSRCGSRTTPRCCGGCRAGTPSWVGPTTRPHAVFTRWWRTWCRAGSANKSLSARRDRFSPTTPRLARWP